MSDRQTDRQTDKYHPEPYWSEVAVRISQREDNNVIAGDDEPYYRYKRTAFLSMLNSVDFNNKSVLEIGCGPGGNLSDILKVFKPSSVNGVDISNNMIALAAKNLSGKGVKLIKIDGLTLPFENNSIDMVFSATVLQHNTDEKMLFQIISEMGRVAKEKVVIFERIEDTITGDDLCLGRPISYYQKAFESNGLKLGAISFINIRVSYIVCGAIRKLLNPKSRKEGEPLNGFSIFLQKISLPLTKVLDKVFTSRKDIAKLEFLKN